MTPDTQQLASADLPRLVVRETACKTILNRTSMGDYSLNCYTGCEHACVYCYARFMQRFHPHAEAWGQFVDAKVNAVEVLRRQLRHAEPGKVFVSSARDGWQSIERERRLTRRCCELLLEYGFTHQVGIANVGCVGQDRQFSGTAVAGIQRGSLARHPRRDGRRSPGRCAGLGVHPRS